MIVLSGADLVLPDRILAPGTLVVENGRIVEIRPGTVPGGSHGAFHHHYIVPGFIDVHVHGVSGIDTLDEGDSIRAIARILPECGVTAFCPTTMACDPGALRRVLDAIRAARERPDDGAARVLPAHLESNFISPEYRGAQPLRCLRTPRAALAAEPAAENETFAAGDLLSEIERAAPDVGIVTLAPELDGALDLIAWLVARDHRVSLGHSAASYEEALAAVAAGARQATHLFNRMPPFSHRRPGLAGAALQSDDLAAELICDGVHVHPAVMRTAIAAKRPWRIMAITDGTAVSRLAPGASALLGGQQIVARDAAATLDDGTMAGSIVTMDRAFQTLVGTVGLSLVDAATVCATTPARELGLVGHGVLSPDAAADFVVLDAQLGVVQTYVGGQLAYSRSAPGGAGSLPGRPYLSSRTRQ